MNLTVVGVYGGVNMKAQTVEVQQGLDILVTTPGRLADLMLNGILMTKATKNLVIDEFDQMLTPGFWTQLKVILDLLPPKRENLLFWSTLTDDVDQLVNAYFNRPVRIEAAPTGTPRDTIDQSACLVPNFYTKINLLTNLLNRNAVMTKMLVFVATKQL